ncbi:MAG: recombinase family protein, partial [Eubacterium sp.]|nr:recombinase family protein [Eubacterium sp.]
QIKGNRIRQDKVGKKSITPLSITGTNKVNIVKVAAYCRVSTDQEGQDESFSIQRKHYVRLIESQPGWELAGIYQERISATNLSERSQLNRLLEDCRQDKVDLVLTKSISRFARNTTDLLWMVRKLSAMGIGIVFEREKIDTRSADGELLLSLLASYAEEESHSFSENNKWAIRKRFEEGTYKYSSAP